MSESDDKKKAREREVFEDALELARSKGGEARRNADRLSGEVDSSGERPDLVIHAPGGRVIGIEHFCVDQLVRHGKSVQSAAARFASDNESRRRKVVGDAPDGELTGEMIALFGDMASRGIQLSKDACLRDLVRSLDARLFGENGHVGKLETYRRNLLERAAGSHVELGYLLEFHTDFRGLLYFDGRMTRQLHVGEMPMFVGLYDLLDRAAHDVDWIVLAFCGAITDEVMGGAVIDCRNGKFRKSLERQGLRRTEFLGLGKDEPKTRQRKPGKATYVEDGENIHYTIENTSEDADASKIWDNALRDGAWALTLGRAGLAFTATIPVQMVYELLRGRTGGLGLEITYGDVTGLIAGIPANKVMAWSEQFGKRWGIREPNRYAASLNLQKDTKHDE